MIEFKKVINIMLCLFICSAAMPLTSIVAEAKYPDGVSGVSAKYDILSKKIRIDYTLNSNSGSGPNILSIGYKFDNPNLYQSYKEQFVNINNQKKGKHTVYLYYPGFPAKISIYTRYKIAMPPGASGGLMPSPNPYENKYTTIIGAPLGPKTTPARMVTAQDVIRQRVEIAVDASLTTLSLAYVPGKLGIVLGTVPFWLENAQGLGSSLGHLKQPFPILRVGQYIEVTTEYKKDCRMYVTTRVWTDRDSYYWSQEPFSKVKPFYDETISVPIY